MTSPPKVKQSPRLQPGGWASIMGRGASGDGMRPGGINNDDATRPCSVCSGKKGCSHRRSNEAPGFSRAGGRQLWSAMRRGTVSAQEIVAHGNAMRHHRPALPRNARAIGRVAPRAGASDDCAIFTYGRRAHDSYGRLTPIIKTPNRTEAPTSGWASIMGRGASGDGIRPGGINNDDATR